MAWFSGLNSGTSLLSISIEAPKKDRQLVEIKGVLHVKWLSLSLGNQYFRKQSNYRRWWRWLTGWHQVLISYRKLFHWSISGRACFLENKFVECLEHVFFLWPCLFIRKLAAGQKHFQEEQNNFVDSIASRSEELWERVVHLISYCWWNVSATRW